MKGNGSRRTSVAEASPLTALVIIAFLGINSVILCNADVGNHVNILPNPRVDPRTQPHLYQSYKAYVDTLKTSVNLTSDPCNNFYEYACGSFDDDMDFDTLQDRNLRVLIAGLKRENQQPYARKAKVVFDKCVYGVRHPEYVHADGDSLRNIYGYLNQLRLVKFPLFGMNADDKYPLEPKELGTLLGILERDLGLTIYLSPSINTNWKSPQPAVGSHRRPYKLYVDQPTLAYPQAYFKKAWDSMERGYTESLKKIARAAAKVLDRPINESSFDKDVEDVVQFERKLALDFNVDENEKRQYERSYNPYNVSQANREFSFVAFDRFLKTLLKGTTAASEVASPDFEFIINEPETFRRLSRFFAHFDNGRVINNYIHLRILKANTRLLPQGSSLNVADEMLRESRGFPVGRDHRQIRRPPTEPRIPRRFDKLSTDDYAEMSCAISTLFSMKDATTRILMDEILGGAARRHKFKQEVGRFINDVLKGFEYQVDRLSWMSKETKEGAYGKIQNLARNIAFPEWVANTSALNEFYSGLKLSGKEDYLELSTALRSFKVGKEYSVLKGFRHAQRDDYLLPMGLVNAWYQPEVNSITFPYAILQQPFYDPNYPAAVNFGALGVIAGHEITHAFDDEGVQYDAVGRLNTWMDAHTQKSFKKMAQCVVDEYSDFEPLPGLPIDGENTQGENIADNGGVRAAFNAFLAHQSFYGLDPQLPDDIFADFSHEQLFFLAFARVWCESSTSAAERLKRQLLVDPHSPSKYRVFGTLQNFPAFRSAFNCPVGTDYAPHPTQHCNVWASEVDAEQDVPQTPAADPDVHIAQPPANNDKAYQDVAQLLAAGINLDVQPCQDFYTYTNTFGKNTTGRDLLAEADAALNDRSVFDYKEDEPRHVKLMVETYQRCLSSYYVSKARVARDQIKKVEQYISVPFDLENGVPSVTINKYNLSKLSAVLAHDFGIELFFKLGVRLNPKPKRGAPVYQLVLDPPELLLETEGYRDTQAASAFAYHLSGVYYDFKSKRIPPDGRGNISRYMAGAWNGEEAVSHFLREKYPQEDEVVADVRELNGMFPNFGVSDYLRQLGGLFDDKVPGLKELLTNGDAEFVVRQPRLLQAVDKFVGEIPTSVYRSRQLWMRIYGRLLWHFQGFLTFRYIEPIPTVLVPLLRDTPFTTSAREAQRQTVCAHQIAGMFPASYTNALVAKRYPTRADFIKAQREVAVIVNQIINQLADAVDDLSWMSKESRRRAVAKLHAMAKIIAAPERVFDNSALDLVYEGFSTEYFIEVFLHIPGFKLQQKLKRVFSESLIRDDYLDVSQPRTLPLAFADTSLNSIVLSLAVLQTPFNNKDYPAAFSYATIGKLIAGLVAENIVGDALHRNEFGTAEKWIDAEAEKHIDEVRQRLVDHYSSVDGSSDGDKLLVDHTALWLTFRALDKHIEESKEDSRLVHPILGHYDAKQLFFISYALEAARSDNESNVHALLANSRHFRDAFHCPLGSRYAPKEVIELWQPSEDDSFGVPEVRTPPPSINVPRRGTKTSAKYLQCAAEFEEAVDVSANPCDDFFQYTCGNFDPLNVLDGVVDNNLSHLYLALIDGDDNGTEPVRNYSVVESKLRGVMHNCRVDVDDYVSLMADGRILKAVVTELEDVVGVQFPWVAENEVVEDLTPKQLGRALGLLAGRYAHDVFWRADAAPDVNGAGDGYALSLRGGFFALPPSMDAAEAALRIALDVTYYIKATIGPEEAQKRADKIAEEAAALVRIETLLRAVSASPSTGNETRRFPTIRVADFVQQFPQTVDIRAFLETFVIDVPEASARVSADDFHLILDSPRLINTFLSTIGAMKQRIGLKPKDLVNYLFWRALSIQNRVYTPSTSDAGDVTIGSLMEKTGWADQSGHKIMGEQVPTTIQRLVEKKKNNHQLGHTWFDEVGCMWHSLNTMPLAGEQLFVHINYVDGKERDAEQVKVAKFAESLSLGVRSMVEQITWMSKDAKRKAQLKLDALIRTISFPGIAVDNVKLEEFYKELVFTVDDRLPDHMIKGFLFNRRKSIQRLALNAFDRSELAAAVYMTGVYHTPWANSLTVPLSMLQQPFYDADWPAVVNYGALGFLAARELVHAVDERGAQWGVDGRLDSWMDSTSFEALRNTTSCLIKQYDAFCFEDGACLNGSLTQAENVADNAGLRAAFRAYRTSLPFNPPEFQLPNDLVGQFTQDQLFFLSFARSQCDISADVEHPPPELITTAPARFRILGTLQNFPAFREAFNCPAGSKYTPKQHCDVLITDFDAAIGAPSA